MSQPIKLEKCALTAIEGKKRNGIVTSKLKFAAIFDQAAAKAIGVEYTLFQKGGDIRTGYASLELDFHLNELKLFYVVKGFETHALDLRSHSADKFVIRKKGDGKKKPSKLVVTFTVLHVGQYLELANWWENYGGADGVLTLAPQQAELPLAEPEKAKKAEPKQTKLEVQEAEREWPKPNEYGVYRQSDATSERINVDQKRFARVYVLQIGQKLIGDRPVGEFIASVNWQLGDGGHSEPLSRPKSEHLIYGSRDAAFLAALSRLAEEMEDYIRPGRSMAEQKAARKIADWAANLAATRYSGMAAASLAAAGGVQ